MELYRVSKVKVHQTQNYTTKWISLERLIKEIPEQKELRNNINSVPSYKQYKQKQQNNY
jgi:hypothetical protein